MSRKISKQEFLRDFRAGLRQIDLLRKYNLNPSQLDSIFQKLIGDKTLALNEYNEWFRRETIQPSGQQDGLSDVTPLVEMSALPPYRPPSENKGSKTDRIEMQESGKTVKTSEPFEDQRGDAEDDEGTDEGEIGESELDEYISTQQDVHSPPATHERDLTSQDRIRQFVEALKQEIEAIQKQKDALATYIMDGQLVRETAGLFIYSFNLENFLQIADDTPVTVEVGGKKSKGFIVSVSGLRLEVAFEADHGASIPRASIVANSAFLLESLVKKFEESLPSASTKFQVSECVFSGQSQTIYQEGQDPKYGTANGKPNPSQEKAISASFQRSLCLIWGPPGTGKTKTIAQSVEAHIRAGRKVLLLAHANTAVDKALEDIAEQCAASYYENLGLIRLGVAQRKELEDKYPLVLLPNVMSKLAAHLIEEKAKLNSRKTQLQRKLRIIEGLLAQREEIESSRRECSKREEELAQEQQRLESIASHLAGLKTRRTHTSAQLAGAQESPSVYQRLFGGSPENLQDQLNSLIEQAVEEEGKLATTQSAYEKIREALDEERDRLHDLETAFAKKLNEHRLKESALEKLKKELNSQYSTSLARIQEITREMEEIENKILSEASLIATTLTKAFTSAQLAQRSFEVLVVDEVSMAPLPHLYWAASKVKQFVTLVGDFNQLPPICISNEEMARRMLGTSIFHFLGLNTPGAASRDQRVSLLNEQYRMNPKIATIANRMFYSRLLRSHPSTKDLVLYDLISAKKNPLVLVDTAKANPWISKVPTGGRFNIHSAITSVAVAEKLLGESPNLQIGVMAPYRGQARLIGRVVKDHGALANVTINTVHSFQGGECSVVIFDCVDGPGLGTKWSMLAQQGNSDAELLLNVALTRARLKVFIIAHAQWFRKYHKESMIQKILRHFGQQGVTIDSTKIMAQHNQGMLLANGGISHYDPETGITGWTFHTEETFWPAFEIDLDRARKTVTIMSPFIAVQRTESLLSSLKGSRGRGVSISIFTKPPKEQGKELVEQSQNVIRQLSSHGIQIVQRSGMHQKVALIDDSIVWEGSLNILSHGRAKEQMRRLPGRNIAKEVRTALELDNKLAIGNVTDVLCQKCQAFMVVRKKGGKGKRFLGCLNFPNCTFTKQLN